jgi:hypothetical protein
MISSARAEGSAVVFWRTRSPSGIKMKFQFRQVIAQLPAILSLFSKNIARAFLLIFRWSARKAAQVIRAVIQAIQAILRWAWETVSATAAKIWSVYCLVETGILTTFAWFSVTMFALRLPLAMLGVGVIFALYKWWWLLSFYVLLVFAAVVVAFALNTKKDYDAELESHDTAIAKLARVLRYPFRMTVAILSTVLGLHITYAQDPFDLSLQSIVGSLSSIVTWPSENGQVRQVGGLSQDSDLSPSEDIQESASHDGDLGLGQELGIAGGIQEPSAVEERREPLSRRLNDWRTPVTDTHFAELQDNREVGINEPRAFPTTGEQETLVSQATAGVDGVSPGVGQRLQTTPSTEGIPSGSESSLPQAPDWISRESPVSLSATELPAVVAPSAAERPNHWNWVRQQVNRRLSQGPPGSLGTLLLDGMTYLAGDSIDKGPNSWEVMEQACRRNYKEYRIYIFSYIDDEWGCRIPPEELVSYRKREKTQQWLKAEACSNERHEAYWEELGDCAAVPLKAEIAAMRGAGN